MELLNPFTNHGCHCHIVKSEERSPWHPGLIIHVETKYSGLEPKGWR